MNLQNGGHIVPTRKARRCCCQDDSPRRMCCSVLQSVGTKWRPGRAPENKSITSVWRVQACKSTGTGAVRMVGQMAVQSNADRLTINVK
jgi:hypothetical protein